MLAAEESYTMEFRTYKDDAWYSVRVLVEGETLVVKYLNFADDNDDVFRVSDFVSHKQLHEFQQRFRFLSKQVQDSECRLLANGVRVCACHRFAEGDLRFYDALVDGVQKSKHSWEGEELCLCTFTLFWIHGPNAGNITAAKIEDICIVQLECELDHVMGSFLDMAREKIELVSSRSISRLEMVPHRNKCLEMVPHRNKSSNTSRGIGYFEQIEKEKQCATGSIVEVFSPEGLLLSNSRPEVNTRSGFNSLGFASRWSSDILWFSLYDCPLGFVRTKPYSYQNLESYDFI